MYISYWEKEYMSIKNKLMDELDWDDWDDNDDEISEDELMREVDQLFFEKFGFEYSNRED